MKKYLLFVLIVLYCSFRVPAQTQLLSNGSFATNGSAWTVSGDFGYGVVSGYTSCYVCNGYAFACNLSNGSPKVNLNGYLEHTATVTIPLSATSATLSFYTNATLSSTSTSLERIFVYLYDYTTSTTYSVSTIYFSGTTSYAYYSYSIPSSIYGHTLKLGFHAIGSTTATTIRVDEVSLSYIPCTSPSASVNSPTGTGSATMTCSVSGGSGGTINYEWYTGSTCSGTFLGTGSTKAVTSSGSYSCRAYISGYYPYCYTCATGYATVNTCTSPTASVNSPTGTGSATMTCTASGGSGGTINYEWYSGTSCSGTAIGIGSTYAATTSGSYTCRAYISGYYSTCYTCATGVATVNAACTSPSATVSSPTGTGSTIMVCTASGGSGGTINYEWYAGTACTGGTPLGYTSTLNVSTSGTYTCRAYISGYYSTCYTCATGVATVNASCTTPSATVNSPTSTGSATMTCTALGGSGGTINYEWYSGTSCTGGTPLGLNPTLTVSTSGTYTCRAYISGYYSSCYACATGIATVVNGSTAKYKLPWANNVTISCTQGNSIDPAIPNYSHYVGSKDEYAYDFDMDEGTLVRAMRNGQVIDIEGRFIKGMCPYTGKGSCDGCWWKVNRIVIQHLDGTKALYMHLQQNGILVSVGQNVKVGDIIGRSGATGCATARHLHVAVMSASTAPGNCSQTPGGEWYCYSIPFEFCDVTVHNGRPIEHDPLTPFPCAIGGGDDETSVPQVANSQAFLLYPNPTSGKINVVVDEVKLGLGARLIIYNLIGQKIKEIALVGKSEYAVDLTSQQNGTYMVQLLSNTIIESKKFTIAR